MLDHEISEALLVEVAPHQALVEGAMGAAELGLKAELRDRGHRAAGTQCGITDFEEGIAPVRQAPIEPGSEPHEAVSSLLVTRVPGHI